MNNEKIKIFVGYAFICLVWGSTWLAIKFGLNTLTPFISAGLRFLIASIIIITVVKIYGTEFHFDSQSIKLYLFMGFFSFLLPFWLVYWAEQYIPSGLTSVLFGFYPFSVFIFSIFLLDNTEVDKFKFLSIILGFIGVGIIFWDGIFNNVENHLLGIAAVLLSATIQGSVSVVIKKWGGYLHPFAMNGPPLFIAGISMISLSFIFEDSSKWIFTDAAIYSIVYLSVFGTILAFTTYYWLLKRINAVLLSLSSFITPIIAVFLGYLFLGEMLSQKVFIGTILVLTGIIFGNFTGIKKIIFKER